MSQEFKLCHGRLFFFYNSSFKKAPSPTEAGCLTSGLFKLKETE